MADRPKRVVQKPQRYIDEISKDRGSATPKPVKQTKRKRGPTKGIQHPKNLQSLGSAPLGQALLTTADEPEAKRPRRSGTKDASETKKKNPTAKPRKASLSTAKETGRLSLIVKLKVPSLKAAKPTGESSVSGEPKVTGDDDSRVSNTGREGSSAVANHGKLAAKLTGLRRDSVQSLKPLRLGHTDAVPYAATGVKPPRDTVSPHPSSASNYAPKYNPESFDPTVTPRQKEPPSFISTHVDAILEPTTPVQLSSREDYDTDQDTPVSSVEKEHHDIILLDDAYTPDEDRGETPIGSLPRATDSPYLFDETDFAEDESHGLKLSGNSPTRARNTLILNLRAERDLINIQRKKIERDMEVREFIRQNPKWDRWGFYENQKEMEKKGAVGAADGPKWDVNSKEYKSIYDVNPGTYDMSVTFMDRPRDLTIIRRELSYAKVRYRYNWAYLAKSFRDELPIVTIGFEAEIVDMIEAVGFPKKLCDDVDGDVEVVEDSSSDDDDEEEDSSSPIPMDLDGESDEPYVFKYWAEDDEE
ncbi:hypothetical protein BU16DRAFT_105460 [Lophium mytilinum]|uniref:Uncharacterized protein n=1 Tax=Lophium mytilinum TaxID=390894 RepID=A0A6A6QKF1_9PEZI|nr:hypothetical protein BU16DRAFT_105460 [Lophium mytilinum]